ncbi:DUF2334 domain-containing protein [Novosphingobium sp.]|uniref:DUF2334 domain-containing protein n=1 Tax=Novosphingobium sp. TaxID=1874826 RepID=UPI00352A7F67
MTASFSSSRRLLVSIHDVSPRFERQVDALAERLAAHLGGPRFAMLVIPDHWHGAPLAEAQAFQRRLRDWADAGVEMFLHGWSHIDETPPQGSVAGFKAKRMTAGEGEFLSLSRAEALARMTRGRALVEQAIGRPVAGFIAPAWLYSDGALEAARHAGFALAEDHMKVWEPATGAVVARGPVVTWASRSRPRIASSIAFAALARTALPHVLPTLRLAVHPGDCGVPALLASIDSTLRCFLRTHRASRYDSVATAPKALAA